MSKVRVDEIETLDGLTTIPLDTIVVDSDMLATNIAVTPAGTISSTTVQAAIQELDGDIGTKQPLDATLTALASQVTAANKLIYATGVDAFAQTDLTPYARTLIAQTNATDARSTLGILPTVLTKQYISPENTIISGGQIILAHSLAETPKIVQVYLKCLVAQHGYSVGDIVKADLGTYNSGGGLAQSVVVDSTNVTIRFSNDTGVFSVSNKTTGAEAEITPSNWRFLLIAFV